MHTYIKDRNTERDLEVSEFNPIEQIQAYYEEEKGLDDVVVDLCCRLTMFSKVIASL
jgi:hypothetical protein